MTTHGPESEAFRHEKIRCPHCGTRLDAAAQMEDGAPTIPKDGDITLCVQCVNVMVYQVSAFGAVSLRVATRKEQQQFNATHGQVRWALRELNRRLRAGEDPQQAQDAIVRQVQAMSFRHPN